MACCLPSHLQHRARRTLQEILGELNYRPDPNRTGPSWLTFLCHAKDNLGSIDFFRCESATIRTHWVLVVMDPFTRRIIGFGIHAGTVDGVALCRMFRVEVEITLPYRKQDRCWEYPGFTATRHFAAYVACFIMFWV